MCAEKAQKGGGGVRRVLLILLLGCALMLTGCSGGQEIESCLFVISMAVDPAQDGNMTVTVKALSGTQEAAAPQGATTQSGQEENGQSGETTESGYVVMSATAESCLAALDLLGATTPRTVNLSQLQEIVLSRTLAESGAALTILREIHALFEANGNAVVVVTPDNAGDFIRRQYAMFGIRLSQYLRVLFEHFEEIGTIPSGAHLSSVISAMESGTVDAAAVYAAKNDFGATLILGGGSVTDRLPGHLPRTSPAQNEYLGSAVFAGPKMTGTLTGDETTMLRLLRGEAIATSFVLGNAMMQVSRRARVTTDIVTENGETVLKAGITMRLLLSAGAMEGTAQDIASEVERSAAALIQKLQAMGSDAIGFGRKAVRQYRDIPSWEASGWERTYREANVQAFADVTIR